QKEDFLKKIKTNLEDAAFKLNGTSQIMQLDIVRVDTFPATMIDTNILVKYSKKRDYFYELAQKTLDEARSETQMMRLSSGLSSALYKNSKENFESKMKEGREYLDSMKKYEDLDSLKRIDMEKKPRKGNVYEVKTFVKAQMTRNTDSKKE